MMLYALMMIHGNSRIPMSSPTALPVTLASAAYSRYFPAMVPEAYPRDFMAPICLRSSSTMRVMVVRATSAATRKKNSGNTVAMAAILSALDL